MLQLEGEICRFPSYPLLLPYPFFFRRLVASSFSRPTRCPLYARMCQLFFSPSFTHVCLLSVGIHPSVRIIITEEFYRDRCSLLVKAFSVCVRRDSPAVFILSTSTFLLCIAVPCVELIDSSIGLCGNDGLFIDMKSNNRLNILQTES